MLHIASKLCLRVHMCAHVRVLTIQAFFVMATIGEKGPNAVRAKKEGHDLTWLGECQGRLYKDSSN